MALTKLIDLEGVEGMLRKIFAAVQYARTNSDQLRVVVDNQASNSIFIGNSGTNGISNAVATIPLYNPSSWNVQDARETARQASETQFLITRQRWTIT